ncbi:MAG TPA: RcnB family protein [Telluria sp.]|jgi:Ni/Co efflux regulator RcnB
MKTKALMFAVLTAACLSSGTAFAQSYDHGDRYQRDDRMWRDGRYEQRRDHRMHRRVRGAGPHHDLYRGTRLPQAYWGRNLRVNNWRRIGLPPPANGNNWVRTGNDYAMVSVSTGLITRIEFGN